MSDDIVALVVALAITGSFAVGWVCGRLHTRAALYRIVVAVLSKRSPS